MPQAAQIRAPPPRAIANRSCVAPRSLPPAGASVEIASGTGEHAVWFSTALPS